MILTQKAQVQSKHYALNKHYALLLLKQNPGTLKVTRPRDFKSSEEEMFMPT